jgi:hypothetical protein
MVALSLTFKGALPAAGSRFIELIVTALALNAIITSIKMPKISLFDVIFTITLVLLVFIMI